MNHCDWRKDRDAGSNRWTGFWHLEGIGGSSLAGLKQFTEIHTHIQMVTIQQSFYRVAAHGAGVGTWNGGEGGLKIATPPLCIKSTYIIDVDTPSQVHIT